MDFLAVSIFELIFEIIFFLLLIVLGSFLFKKIRNSDNRFLNPKEFLPDDEIHTLKQVAYLILLSFCFINLVYSIVLTTDLFYFAVFDIVLSLYIAITIDIPSRWKKVLIFLLIPFGSLSYSLFNYSVIIILDFIHIPVFLYLMKYYYTKFRHYTESNGLGFAILLLFVIIFVSFFITQIVERVNPLDAIVMVSNAFTSNGYSILGNSIAGKINSIFLVWGGYIISGAGTATLTAAILIKHFNRRIKKLEKLIEEEL